MAEAGMDFQYMSVYRMAETCVKGLLKPYRLSSKEDDAHDPCPPPQEIDEDPVDRDLAFDFAQGCCFISKAGFFSFRKVLLQKL